MSSPSSSLPARRGGVNDFESSDPGTIPTREYARGRPYWQHFLPILPIPNNLQYIGLSAMRLACLPWACCHPDGCREEKKTPASQTPAGWFRRLNKNTRDDQQRLRPYNEGQAAMLRSLFLPLIIYPLLMPPGVCLCGFGGLEGRQRLSANHKGDGAESIASGRRAGHDCCSSLCGHGGPSHRHCPPACPANEKADHAKLLARGIAAADWAAAIPRASFDVDPAGGRPIASSSLLKRPSRPVYLTLCTLLI